MEQILSCMFVKLSYFFIPLHKKKEAERSNPFTIPPPNLKEQLKF